jgi:uncharacterized protein YutE (UPF0331/DUF86 family)
MDEYLHSLDRSLETLIYYFNKCSKIGKKDHYDLEEQESSEALTSRFARTSDILTQKILKAFYMLMQEDIRSHIDGANFLEKLEIIEKSEDLLNIRELRNQIAHEYVDTELPSLFSDVLHHIELLRDIITNVKQYIIQKKLFMPKP